MDECRICLETGDVLDLITPCNCKGTVSLVHEVCLQKWRDECRGTSEYYSKCEICGESYIIVKDEPVETLFICTKYGKFIRCMIVLLCIWVLSALVWLIDFHTNRFSVKMIGIKCINKDIKNMLNTQIWGNIAYYQSLGTFIFSFIIFVIVKICSVLLIENTKRYCKLMLLYDIFYILGLISYPVIIIFSCELDTIIVLWSLGGLTIFLNIPLILIYAIFHNDAIFTINTIHSKDKIMNIDRV